MGGLRADIGQFEQRVFHDLPLQCQVILDLGRLLDRGRKSTELGRWRWARSQIRIDGEDRVRQVAECAEEGRGAGSKSRIGLRKYVVMEYTESRPQDRGSAFVESPSKADSRLEVFFRYGEEMVLRNRWRGIRQV